MAGVAAGDWSPLRVALALWAFTILPSERHCVRMVMLLSHDGAKCQSQLHHSNLHHIPSAIPPFPSPPHSLLSGGDCRPSSPYALCMLIANRLTSATQVRCTVKMRGK